MRAEQREQRPGRDHQQHRRDRDEQQPPDMLEDPCRNQIDHDRRHVRRRRRGETRMHPHVQHRRRVGRQIDQHVGHTGADRDGAGADRDPVRHVAQHAPHRRLGTGHGQERLRLVELPPQPQADRPDQRAQREGDPEAGCFIIARVQQGPERPAGPRRQRGGDVLAGRLEAGEEAGTRRIVLEQERGRRPVLPAQREALHQPPGQHQQGRGEADPRRRRHHREHRAAERHQHDRDRHRCPPSVPVSDAAQHRGPDRTRQERHAERHERQQQPRCGVMRWEERPRDQRREEAVDDEIVELERIADRGRRDDPQRPAMPQTVISSVTTSKPAR